MANTKITGKLAISKVDADTEKLLPNAGFRIYAADGETVLKEGYTDKKGVAEFELEFGKYYYQEFDAPDGYKIDDTKYEFSITEDGRLVSVVMTNQLEETPETPTPTENQKETTPGTTTTTETPKTNTTTSADGPKTGDDSNIALWAGIAAAAIATSAAGLVILGRSGKKKDDENEENE